MIGLREFEEDFREQEKRTQAESLALLTIATFFTSITASILVASVQQKSTLYDIVNFFWFTSLVLSITSVMNSLLALTWKQSILYVQSPSSRLCFSPIFSRKRYNDEQLPRPIALWSRDSPLYFLVMAALTFIVGLCLFAYASGQVSSHQ